MTIRTIEPEQQRAAKVVGFLYLVTMATGVFGTLYGGVNWWSEMMPCRPPRILRRLNDCSGLALSVI